MKKQEWHLDTVGMRVKHDVYFWDVQQTPADDDDSEDFLTSTSSITPHPSHTNCTCPLLFRRGSIKSFLFVSFQGKNEWKPFLRDVFRYCHLNFSSSHHLNCCYSMTAASPQGRGDGAPVPTSVKLDCPRAAPSHPCLSVSPSLASQTQTRTQPRTLGPSVAMFLSLLPQKHCLRSWCRIKTIS